MLGSVLDECIPTMLYIELGNSILFSRTAADANRAGFTGTANRLDPAHSPQAKGRANANFGTAQRQLTS
jgi:hypothetical protein